MTVFPHADWRGRYALGTYGAQGGYGAGTTTMPCVTITRDTNFQEIVWEPGATQEPRSIGPRNTAWRHCVEILWPAPHEYVTRSQKGTPTRLGPPSWNGSLLDGMRDVSGMMYRRNRYYDPSTAQFTQEDPIGMAGGLNLYGFANGDPITYSDPFGLRAECCTFGYDTGIQPKSRSEIREDLRVMGSVLSAIIFGPDDPDAPSGSLASPGLMDPVAWVTMGVGARLGAARVALARSNTGRAFNAFDDGLIERPDIMVEVTTVGSHSLVQ